MKNELLKNKIIDSIASKTVSDNLIYLSIAMLKHKNYIITKQSKKQSKYGRNIEFLHKAAVDNGISGDNIGKKVNSITIESYVNCISLKQALKISGMCNRGDYIYDKDYLPDAVCGFVSDEEYASMLRDFGFVPEDDTTNEILEKSDTISKSGISHMQSTIPDNMPSLPDRMKYIYEIIDNLSPVLWHGKKVIITSQAKQVFDVSDSILHSRFKKFKDKFKLGTHYYKLEYKDIKILYNLGYFDNANLTHTYCWTQSGTLLLAKSLNNFNLNKNDKHMKIYQYLVEKYFSIDIRDEIEKRGLVKNYTQSIDNIQVSSDTGGNQQQSINQPNQPESLKIPIGIALGIDEDGMTTAKKLYKFLELNPVIYARWCRINIIENPFVKENEDYFYLTSMQSGHKRDDFAQDFKLTAHFAKALSLYGKTERAEQAMEYFTGLERKQFFKPSKTNTESSTTDLTVKDVDLFGDTVVAAQDKNGVIWAGVKWFCDGLGLSKGQIKAERKKIQEDIVLSQGTKFHPLGTGNANKDVLCLKLDFFPLWLAKISITPNMKKNNPELVEKLIKYQLEAKDVLAAAFLPESYKIKTPKQYQINKGKHLTSSTPIPKIKDEMDYTKEIESSKP